MTPSEFVSGEGVGRLRRMQSAQALLKQAEAARERYIRRNSELADKRLQLLVSWWHQKYPTRSLQILFGNGTEHIAIDGRNYYPPYGPKDATDGQLCRRGKRNWQRSVPAALFAPLHQAIWDIDTITDGHRNGVPADFTILPIKQRKRIPHESDLPPLPKRHR